MINSFAQRRSDERPPEQVTSNVYPSDGRVAVIVSGRRPPIHQRRRDCLRRGRAVRRCCAVLRCASASRACATAEVRTRGDDGALRCALSGSQHVFLVSIGGRHPGRWRRIRFEVLVSRRRTQRAVIVVATTLMSAQIRSALV